MYDKERGLYIAHCANGTLSITGKMAAVPEPVLLSANAKKVSANAIFSHVAISGLHTSVFLSTFEVE